MAANDAQTFLLSAIKDGVAAIGRNYDLKLILLHGSFVDGTASPASDLDIAILGKREISSNEYADIHHDFFETFDRIAPNRELDLKTLHRADPLFCYQVAKKSLLLYGSIAEYNDFLAYAFKYYMDSKDLFELERTLVFKFQEYLNERYALGKQVPNHDAY